MRHIPLRTLKHRLPELEYALFAMLRRQRFKDVTGFSVWSFADALRLLHIWILYADAETSIMQPIHSVHTLPFNSPALLHNRCLARQLQQQP